VLGALDKGFALTYASGAAAILAALYTYKPATIFITRGYQGTHSVIEQYLKQTGTLTEWSNRKQKLDKDSNIQKVIFHLFGCPEVD